MAGYIMTIGAGEYLSYFSKEKCSNGQKELLAKDKAMVECITHGIYSTLLDENSNSKIGTRADYFGMKKGDNIYFFYNRSIYGIGELVDIDGTCCFFNPIDDYLYAGFPDKTKHPYFCLFKPSPFFFKEGVDMDDVLMSHPNAFRKLRFFHNRSFIHLDDVENLALKSYFIQKHEDILATYDCEKHFNTSKAKDTYDSINKKFITDFDTYKLDAVKVFEEGIRIKKYPNMISSEYYVEGMILEYVKTKNNLLGYWNFMSRQYVASPNKPAEYADNMDLFGYRYVKGYEKEGIISKYVIIELKSRQITEATILQVMKYVDWVSKEFAHNDYSMIEAYVIGYSADDDLMGRARELYTRNYIKSSKHNANRGIEVETGKWQNIKYLSYVDILEDMKSKLY